MSSFSPHDTLLVHPAEYEGIHLDAFFFVRTVVGLPASEPLLGETDKYLGFSILELTTI